MEFICGILIFSGIAQGAEPASEKPLPPPVNIEFNMEKTLVVGDEVILKLKVMPLEDMHIDISCLLPEGVEAISDQGIMVRSYIERQKLGKKMAINRQEAKLFVGHLSANIAKELSFKIKATNKGKKEITAVINPLSKWKELKEILIIDVE